MVANEIAEVNKYIEKEKRQHNMKKRLNTNGKSKKQKQKNWILS